MPQGSWRHAKESNHPPAKRTEVRGPSVNVKVERATKRHGNSTVNDGMADGGWANALGECDGGGANATWDAHDAGADCHRPKKEALMKEGRGESMGSPGTSPGQTAESTPAEGQPIRRRHGMPKLELMRVSMASPFAFIHWLPLHLSPSRAYIPCALSSLFSLILSPVPSHPSDPSHRPPCSLIPLFPLAVPVLSHPSAAPCCPGALSSLCCPLLSRCSLIHLLPLAVPLPSLIPLLPLTVPRALSSYQPVYLSFISSRRGTGCAWKLPTMP
ncbi:unnamed protein product [Closterium sp. Naga37s-1]|nr:unnamed protein product [Closterium sp. Naga37s-1]